MTLMNERLAVGGSLATSVDPMLELAAAMKIDGKPAIRNEAVRETTRRLGTHSSPG